MSNYRTKTILQSVEFQILDQILDSQLKSYIQKAITFDMTFNFVCAYYKKKKDIKIMIQIELNNYI